MENKSTQQQRHQYDSPFPPSHYTKAKAYKHTHHNTYDFDLKSKLAKR